VWPRGADPSKPLTQSRLSFTRVSKEQRLEQASARILEASAIAAAGRAAEEAELRRIAENSRAGAAARRHASRAVRKASKRAIPIIGALAALRQDDSESDEEPVGGPGRGGRPGPRGRYEAFTKEEQAIAVSFHVKQQGLGWQTSGVTQGFDESEKGKFRVGCAKCKWAGCAFCRTAMEAHTKRTGC
jgi:hypothetical protein